MTSTDLTNCWNEFLKFAEKKCSPAEFQNWLNPIEIIQATPDEIILQVPNIFVKEYLLDNYGDVLKDFLPQATDAPTFSFVISDEKKKKPKQTPTVSLKEPQEQCIHLNRDYTFENFIEGPSNQFIKSAALGVAGRPGKSYNPLFIHGGVGLGKTHLLHGIGHHVLKNKKKQRIQCITTEAFINDLVDHLRNKSIDKMKKFYRNLDVLLVDDIQFLQNRLNFEDEFCNTFEALINQNKQIVITSDKPPSQLKLSERIIARMEWGLVANVGLPDLETRAAIIQHKASHKGFTVPNDIAFFIAEHVYTNVRQIEGAINRLSAYCRLMQVDLTQDLVEKILAEVLQVNIDKQVTVENILKSVASVFEVRVSDIKGDSRLKQIALARQVAMYLAKELIQESLMKIATSFGGKTHSTLLHAWKKITDQLEKNEQLRRQVQLIKRNIED